MGITGLTRRKNEQQVPNYYDLLLNEETSRYVFRILAFKELFENPQNYGYHMDVAHYYKMPELKEIKVTESIDDLAHWAIQHKSNYKELKNHNPWLRSSKLPIKKGKSYTIKLPA
jgi:membrane-bound lytic murein transglycosylase D